MKTRSVSKYNKILSNTNRHFDIEFIADDKPKSEWFVYWWWGGVSYWTDNVHKGVSSRTQGVEGCEGGVGLSRLELFHNTGYVIS